MGWAGPAQPTGPGSAQNCWADFGPNWVGPISAHKLVFSSGPDPAQKAGLGQDQPGPSTRLAGPEQVWPSTRNQWGKLFPPHPRACRTNVLHVEGNAGHGNNMRGKERLPGAEEAVALVLLLLPEAVLWRRPVAASSGAAVPTTAPSGATVSHGATTFFPAVLAFSHVPSRFLAFLPLGLGFLVVISLFFSVFFSFFFLGFSLLFSPPFGSLSFRVFFLFSSFPLLFSAFLGSIYRGQGRCFLQLSRGAAGWSAIGRGCRGSVGGARWVVGHCVRSVGSRQERGAGKNFKKKHHFSLLPRCMFGGEEER